MHQSGGINESQERCVTSDVYDVGSATNIKFHDGMVPRETKEKLLNQKGVVIWFTGAYGNGFGCQCDLVYCVCQRKQNVGKASTPRRQVDEDLICLD